MSWFNPQNPGIGGLDELTTTEEAAVQTIAALGSPGQFLRTNLAGTSVEWTTGGGGASAFTDLTDVPSAYTGHTLKVVRVNAGETGLEFVTISGGGDALIANPLSQFAATTSLQLKGVISDETGSGELVFATSPTLVTPVLGAATGTSLQLSGLTASEIVITDASKNLVSAAVATYPSLTELTYVKGVTSAIQTQIGTKAPSTSPTFATSITGSYLTASEMLITDGSKNIVSAPVATYPSLTELTYLKGVTSALQTQINAKGVGNVTKVATPVNNQVGVWTGDGTLEGDAALTFETTTDVLNVPNVVVSSVAGQAQLTTFAVGSGGGLVTPHFQVIEPSTASAGIGFARFAGATATQAPRFVLSRSKGDTIGTYTIVASGDTLGEIAWNGADGTDFTVAAAIGVYVDGTPGNDDMPGRIVFSTTADGASTITDRIIIDSAGAIKPATDNGVTLGNATNRFADLFLAEGGVINWDNGDATITQTADDITVAGITTFGIGTGTTLTTGPIELGHATDTTLSRSAAGVLAVEGVVIPSISSINTLTNKRVTKRTGTTTSHATPTINTDNVDFYSITAQTEAITSMTTNLSGTPTEGQTLWIAITGTAARAITWGASFEASTVALPTTTVTTARLDVGFVWNTVTSKWRVVATC